MNVTQRREKVRVGQRGGTLVRDPCACTSSQISRAAGANASTLRVDVRFRFPDQLIANQPCVPAWCPWRLQQDEPSCGVSRRSRGPRREHARAPREREISRPPEDDPLLRNVPRAKLDSFRPPRDSTDWNRSKFWRAWLRS